MSQIWSILISWKAIFVPKRCRPHCSSCILTNFLRYHSSPRHFVSYNRGKLGGTRHKGRNSAVKSIQSSWTGQYEKCVQYDFKFTSVYSKPWPLSSGPKNIYIYKRLQETFCTKSVNFYIFLWILFFSFCQILPFNVNICICTFNVHICICKFNVHICICTYVHQ